MTSLGGDDHIEAGGRCGGKTARCLVRASDGIGLSAESASVRRGSAINQDIGRCHGRVGTRTVQVITGCARARPGVLAMQCGELANGLTRAKQRHPENIASDQCNVTPPYDSHHLYPSQIISTMNNPDPTPAPTSRRRISILIVATAAIISGLTLWVGKHDVFSPPASAEAPTPLSDRPAESTQTALVQHDAPFRTQGISVTIAPGEGAEVLAAMDARDAFVFAWFSQGGKVTVDLHGAEEKSEEGRFTSYHEAEKVHEGFGHFVAPFSGTHGWYWRNESGDPVTINVTVSGYFEDLFVEDGSHSEGSTPHGRSRIKCCSTQDA